jgi:sulfite exporter TauE/SafE
MDPVAGVLLASLLGSPHCAAMCGPFVAFYSGSAPGARAGTHVAYSLGRFTAYVVLGALAGALGAGVDRMGAMAGVARLAAIVAGAMMVAWGLGTIATWRGVRMTWLHAPAFLRIPVMAAMSRARAWPPLARSAAVGLATALLPCGWLYAFVAVAAGTGSPIRGAIAMALFWSGTLPIMLSLGVGLQRITGPLRARLPVVTAVVVVALGLLTIGGRLESRTVPAVAGARSGAHAGHQQP